jgi:nucleotide-binding universal stress UspA family protein
MLESFRTILLPVDLNGNTEIAVKKAMDLADPMDSTIHLLHVIKNIPNHSEITYGVTNRSVPEKRIRRYLEREEKMRQWKAVIEQAKPGIQVEIHLVNGRFIQNKIIEAASILGPQLIIIAKSSNRRWFSFLKTIEPGLLAEITNAAVLTVKPGAMNGKIKSIVIPIRSFIPKRKFEFLVPLIKKRKLTVYLLSLLDEENGFDDSAASLAFVETYRLLKDKVNCQIVHKLITSHNIAKTVLQFAQSVHADMLMVNPEENWISKFLELDICDRLMSNSSLQVLAVDRLEKTEILLTE